MNQKISQLTPILQADLAPNDLFVVVDTSASQDKSITVDQLDQRYAAFQTQKITLTAAQIKTLSSIPVVLVTPPSGKFVQLIAASLYYHFNTAAFTSNLITLNIGPAGGIQMQSPGSFLAGGADAFGQFVLQQIIGSAPAPSIVATADIDSAVGDGSVSIYVTYQLVTI